MAAFEHIQNMNDISLKPRLLRSLLKEYVPDDKRPLRNPLDLSHVVSTVRTHNLLSELAAGSTDGKQLENWKAAVDGWVNRILMLVSSTMADKCWVGICLLGVTCRECSSERFLASYSVWFHKLWSHLQILLELGPLVTVLCHLFLWVHTMEPPAESHLVKVASCVSTSDLLTRLAGLPNAKKDGTSHATKLVQPILKLLSGDNSDAVWEVALCLLCTIINFFPSSVHRHYDSAEAAITLKLMSGKCSHAILQKLGHCLALLPKTRGDEDSWSLMMQKVLLSINGLLNDAFQGLEEDTKTNEAMRVLVPPGKDPPPPLGGLLLDASQQAIKPERLLMPTISALLYCCCTMLSSSYPVKVTVPIRPLIMLVRRVLMVDGTLPHALYPFLTAMQQELICSELPDLHLYTLELISGIVKEVRSQTLPHAAEIVRLITGYFRRCAMPKLRIKLYAIIRLLLMSMGVGITVYLAQEVVNNSFVDLDSNHSGDAYSITNLKALSQPKPRKRKHEMTIASLEGQSNKDCLPENLTPVSVKIAALEALETLLTVGGAFRSERWRLDVDNLLINVATDSCKEGWVKEEENVFHPSGPRSTWSNFQLAALRALLSSLISPCRVRPPYLSQGLELFRRGKQETGTKVAEFCTHALLALEVLIHPRALPLIDYAFASGNSFDAPRSRFQENMFSGVQKPYSFPSGTLKSGPADPESEDDDLYDSWQRIGEESENPVAEPGKTNDTQKTNSTVAEKQHFAENSSDAKVPKDGEHWTPPIDAIRGKGKEILTETQAAQETLIQIERIAPEGPAIALSDSLGAQSGRVASTSGALDLMDIEKPMGKDDTETGGGVPASQRDGSASKGGHEGTTVGGITYTTISTSSGTTKEFVFAVHNESSLDEIPDIIDVEPESDEN